MRRALKHVGIALAAGSLILFTRCVGGSEDAIPATRVGAASDTDCIIVAGHRVRVGTRVVTYEEAGGYSAYRRGKHFDRSRGGDGKRRYGERPGDPETLAELRDVVHQFVVHYDVCGTSRQCFKVLHDIRNLSVHFLLDVDGTIYQTLDVKERAWHATIANNGSVGIEIAHPGAWLSPLNADMRRWYEQDQDGWRMRFPAWMAETGVRTPDFVPRPARPQFVSGFVQGEEYHQFDFTAEQYEALALLLAGLNQALPRIQLEAPRDIDGGVADRALSPDALLRFDGVVGHYHVQTNKQDPGPAFQWERVLAEARSLRGY
ncbi:MAG: peptidoglycan recognition family protein [Planctomycetota bacterium]|nr:peptidoglycan recognition family protein [Planctomycetota bacterium]